MLTWTVKIFLKVNCESHRRTLKRTNLTLPGWSRSVRSFTPHLECCFNQWHEPKHSTMDAIYIIVLTELWGWPQGIIWSSKVRLDKEAALWHDLSSSKQALINERCSPEVLTYQSNLLNNLQSMIKDQVCPLNTHVTYPLYLPWLKLHQDKWLILILQHLNGSLRFRRMSLDIFNSKGKRVSWFEAYTSRNSIESSTWCGLTYGAVCLR